MNLEAQVNRQSDPIEEDTPNENPTEYWAEFHDEPTKVDYALFILYTAERHLVLDEQLEQLTNKLDSAFGIRAEAFAGYLIFIEEPKPTAALTTEGIERIERSMFDLGILGYQLEDAVSQYSRGKPELLDTILEEFKDLAR